MLRQLVASLRLTSSRSHLVNRLFKSDDPLDAAVLLTVLLLRCAMLSA